MPISRAWVFLLLPIVPIAAVLAAGDASRSIDRRFGVVRAAVRDDCRAARAAHDGEGRLCADDEFGGSLAFYKRGTAAVDQAVANARARDAIGFGTEIARAIDACNRADDDGRYVASLASASLMKRILDALEANERLLDDESRRTLLARAHLRSARHPLDVARIDHGFWVTKAAESMPPPLSTALKLRAVDDVRETNLVLGAMDRALADGDVARCKRVAASAKPPKSGLMSMLTSEEACTKAANAMDVAKRLDRAKTAPPPAAKRSCESAPSPAPPPFLAVVGSACQQNPAACRGMTLGGTALHPVVLMRR